MATMPMIPILKNFKGFFTSFSLTTDLLTPSFRLPAAGVTLAVKRKNH